VKQLIHSSELLKHAGCDPEISGPDLPNTMSWNPVSILPRKWQPRHRHPFSLVQEHLHFGTAYTQPTSQPRVFLPGRYADPIPTIQAPGLFLTSMLTTLALQWKSVSKVAGFSAAGELPHSMKTDISELALGNAFEAIYSLLLYQLRAGALWHAPAIKGVVGVHHLLTSRQSGLVAAGEEAGIRGSMIYFCG